MPLVHWIHENNGEHSMEKDAAPMGNIGISTFCYLKVISSIYVANVTTRREYCRCSL